MALSTALPGNVFYLIVVGFVGFFGNGAHTLLLPCPVSRFVSMLPVFHQTKGVNS